MNNTRFLIFIFCALVTLSACEGAKDAAEATKEAASNVANKAGDVASSTAEKAGELAEKAKNTVTGETATNMEAIESALSAARQVAAEADQVGAQWRDTEKILKSAEKAAADGNLEEAMKLAIQARLQSEQALEQLETNKAAGPRF